MDQAVLDVARVELGVGELAGTQSVQERLAASTLPCDLTATEPSNASAHICRTESGENEQCHVEPHSSASSG